jgi:hypothetical protein
MDLGTAQTLLDTLSAEQGETLVRRPRSTVAPPHDLKLGKRAFEVLKTLTHDPRGWSTRHISAKAAWPWCGSRGRSRSIATSP